MRVFRRLLCEVLGPQQVRTAVRQAITRALLATASGCVGPIRLCVELRFLCGSAFDTDPQYARLGTVLHSAEPEMARAEEMHAIINHYLEDVAGADSANVRHALFHVQTLARTPLDMPGGVLEELKRAFPQKVGWVGEDALRELGRAAVAQARQYGFSTQRQFTLMLILMFSFGQGCTDDPLYPWISNTLRDPRIVDAAARAHRLERKALTWLDHVLDGKRQRGIDL